MRMLSINIPFAGFYGSIWDSEIDSWIEREIEYQEEYRESELPEPIRLNQSEIADIFWQTPMSGHWLDIARAYTDAMAWIFEDDTGLPLRLSFEALDSPREYNFETDRIFARVPALDIVRLFRASRENGHAQLVAAIKERFSSHDGFISHYSNKLADWLERPLLDWDHNELGTLLGAVWRLHAPDIGDALDMKMFDVLYEHIGRICDEAFDWKYAEKAMAEARDAKQAEWEAENGGNPLPYRCPDTPDMFGAV